MTARKKTQIEPLKLPDTPLAFRFNVLAKQYYGVAARKFEELDIERNFFVLNLIAKHQPITQQCLANCLQVDKAFIVRVIDYLSSKGLVKREISKEDRREHRIVATQKAVAYVNMISTGFNQLNKTAFKGFNKDEQERFLEMMDRMQNNLADLPAENYSLKYIKSKRTT